MKAFSIAHKVSTFFQSPSVVSRCPHGHDDYHARSPGTHNCPASATMPPPGWRTLLPNRAVLTPKPCARPHTASTHHIRPQLACSFDRLQSRTFGLSTHRYRDEEHTTVARSRNHKNLEDQESDLEESIAQEKEKQTRAPWHREGSDLPPVARQRSAGAMTKGMGFYGVHCCLYLTFR